MNARYLSPSSPSPLDLLILGAGWTSTFLISLVSSCQLTYAATTRTGRDNTIPFAFDPGSDDLAPYVALPLAKHILITFPLKGAEEPKSLVQRYCRAHGLALPVSTADSSLSAKSYDDEEQGIEHKQAQTLQPHWIQFGTTSVFSHQGWNTPTSPGPDLSTPRAQAEEALLNLSYPPLSCSLSSAPSQSIATILHLSGLYGGSRIPRNWIPRVAKSRADAKAKNSLHLIHGDDVARAVVGVMQDGKWDCVRGKRWIISDLHVWDWWDVFWEVGGKEDGGIEEEGSGKGGDVEMGVRERRAKPEWANGKSWRQLVAEFMDEDGVRALPRAPEALGRCLDARDFWRVVGVVPGVGRGWAKM